LRVFGIIGVDFPDASISPKSGPSSPKNETRDAMQMQRVASGAIVGQPLRQAGMTIYSQKSNSMSKLSAEQPMQDAMSRLSSEQPLRQTMSMQSVPMHDNGARSMPNLLAEQCANEARPQKDIMRMSYSELSAEFWPASFRQTCNSGFRQQHVLRGTLSNLRGQYNPSRGPNANISTLNGGGVIVQRRSNLAPLAACMISGRPVYSISNKGRMVMPRQR